METLYRKIEIKSESDLPKEDKVYISRTKQGHIAQRRFDSTISKEVSFSNVSVEFWLNNVDWYFAPVQMPDIAISELSFNEHFEKEIKCPKCKAGIKNLESKGSHYYCHNCNYEWNFVS